MSEMLNESQKKPSVVIFVSILNFFSAVLWFLGAAFFATALVFGNAVSFYQKITSQLQKRMVTENLSTGLNVVLIFLLAFSLCLACYHLLLGIGLQKGKGAAWYVQIVTPILCLILIPYGTIVSVIILIFFFQPNIRSYFKV